MKRAKLETFEPQFQRLSPISLDKLLDKPLPPKKLVLKPWLPEKGLAMIYGYRGVGKTHFVIGIALAISCGKEFLGWSAPRPQRVVLIDGEMSATELQDRFKRAVRQLGARPKPSYLRIVSADLQEHGIRDLSTPEGQHALNDVTANADVIILDNLSTLCGAAGAENEAESWSFMQDWLLSMRRDGKSVIFIHHAGKTGKQRGTSKREDVLNTVIKLETPTGSTPDKTRVGVSFEKNRGFYGAHALPFVAELTNDGWRRDTAEEELVAAARRLERSGMNQRDIAKELGKSPATINRRLNKAKNQERQGKRK